MTTNTKERADFEAWIDAEYGPGICLHKVAWSAWQASRRAAPVEAKPDVAAVHAELMRLVDQFCAADRYDAKHGGGDAHGRQRYHETRSELCAALLSALQARGGSDAPATAPLVVYEVLNRSGDGEGSPGCMSREEFIRRYLTLPVPAGVPGQCITEDTSIGKDTSPLKNEAKDSSLCVAPGCTRPTGNPVLAYCPLHRGGPAPHA